jgi:hypothetical protein
MWFNADNPRTMIESNDGGATISQDAGKSWSSILNQPTAELYMVDADEQFPYRLYAPQQDNSTLIVASEPPYSWTLDDPAQTFSQASGCESGQIRPTPDGKIVYGDCKGEFGRYNVALGQEQKYWINPEQRYGKNPKDMKFRFVRQAPIEIDPHNPQIVYHGSQFLHKTIDGGVTWTTISPDLTADGPEGEVTSGEPITRDMTGEEVYAALYSIRASRLEPGVIWTGSNDGVVSVTRDAGKTWKNVTPADLPPGGRVHTIEDSPHRKGSAYVAVYRIYLNDFKPYLYMTNDYGEHWTLLTSGTNGIPPDHPMHVVREDPEREGLLYAGTWYGAFVSFDQGQHWQTLQQNLPATPVTDFKVHHGDLIASTMGRGFWIMDDIAPLRQIASSAAKGSNVFLFKPAAAYRTHYAATTRPGWPEYSPVGVKIDYHLTNPEGELKLDILDAAGKVVRSYSSEGRTPARAGGGRGNALPTTLPNRAGMNRFIWDLRYTSGAGASAQAGEGNEAAGLGPMAAPGAYRARLTAGAAALTAPITVKIDPRVARDGITTLDLVAQTKLALKVRDLTADARALASRVRAAMSAKTGDAPKLQAVYDRLVTRTGPYEDQMFIDQLVNLNRAIGSNDDQKVQPGATERYNELLKEWASIKADADKALGTKP